MAAFLYRLGRLAFRRRWYAVALWVLVLCGVAAGAATASSAADSGFSMPGTESQKAFDLIQQKFPGASAQGADARIVFVAPGGQQVTAAANQAAIEHVVAEVTGDPQVANVSDPFKAHTVSGDGSTAYASVNYTVKQADLTDAAKTALSTAVQHGREAGLTVEVGGSVLATSPSPGGPTEGIGIVIAALVLLITFGSLAAAGLPLLTAIMSVGVGTAGIMASSSAFGLSSSTMTLATMLGLAVGIDYAVFIVSRYREERARGQAPVDAVGSAVGTAGSSVVFAGLTVIIGLAGLSVVGIPALTKMGLAAAGAVAVAVLVALTLVPALLGFFPKAVLSRTVRKRSGVWGPRETGIRRPGAGARWARLVLRRPLPVLLLAVVGLGVVALPAASLHLGTAGDGAKPTSTSERRAYDDLANGFGPGFNGPLTIVVDAHGAGDPKAAVTSTAQKIGATPGVVSVSAPRFDTSGDTATLSAVPATAPDDTRTADLIGAIRAERPAIDAATGATFLVSGKTAADIDSAQKVQDALIPYLAVVVGLAILLLMVVFRSVLVPLKAALGFLLSVLAAIGAVVAVFQWGWAASLIGLNQTGPIMSLMPIFMVGIIFGLAMDYEVFLVSRIREAHVHGEDPEAAIVAGFRHSSRVVAAAALIMTAVFSGFIGAGEPIIKTMGFGLAIAVLFDAFVVRMAIVPAILALLGARAWWMPRWLDKALPSLDIEGEGLAAVSAAGSGGDVPDDFEPSFVATR